MFKRTPNNLEEIRAELRRKLLLKSCVKGKACFVTLEDGRTFFISKPYRESLEKDVAVEAPEAPLQRRDEGEGKTV